MNSIRQFSVLAMSAMVFSVPGSAFAGPFYDVLPTYPYAEGIEYAHEQGIIEGYKNGPSASFQPNDPILRIELVKMIMVKNNRECLPSQRPLKDTRKDQWYWQYLCPALQSNIVSGYADGTFRPDAYVNMAEAAKIIARAGGHTESSSDGSGPWYQASVEWLADRQAIPLSVNSFDHLLTRGEMAEILYRLSAQGKKYPSWTYGELRGIVERDVSGSIPTANYSGFSTMSVAIEKNQPDLCDEWIGDPDYGWLTDTCRVRVAVVNANLAACAGSASCYEKAAVGLKDITVCDQELRVVEDRKEYERCIGRFSDELPLAKELPTYCEFLTLRSIHDVCLTNISIAENDVTLCDRVVEINSIDKCFGHFGKIYSLKGKADEVCPRQEGVEYGGGQWCYRWFAIHTGDASLCAHVPEQNVPNNGPDECRSAVEAYRSGR